MLDRISRPKCALCRTLDATTSAALHVHTRIVAFPGLRAKDGAGTVAPASSRSFGGLRGQGTANRRTIFAVQPLSLSGTATGGPGRSDLVAGFVAAADDPVQGAQEVRVVVRPLRAFGRVAAASAAGRVACHRVVCFCPPLAVREVLVLD